MCTKTYPDLCPSQKWTDSKWITDLYVKCKTNKNSKEIKKRGENLNYLEYDDDL